MSKEIIVNGVDVSGCEFCDWKGSDIPQCRIRQVSFEPTCKGYNCHYKQLQHKEKECNKLYIQLKADEEYHKEEENTLRKIIKNKEERNIELYKENNKLKQTLTEIKEIAEPYKMLIKKICGNCKKYDGCHACCYKDMNCYKYTSADTNACEDFTYSDGFVPNILANNILQKISECGVENGCE